MKKIESANYMVAFISRLNSEAFGYEEMSNKMQKMVSSAPGLLGFDSVRDSSGFGITLSYWESIQSIQNWKLVPEHLEAQKRGQQEWYREFQIVVSKIERITT